jgi:hypothetical protein
VSPPLLALTAYPDVWGPWLLATSAVMLVLISAAYGWWRIRRWPLLALALLSALPAAACGAMGAPRLGVDVQRVLIARQMGIALSDERFDHAFPAGYLASLIVPSRSTRDEVHALVPGARARYACGNSDTFFFFSERIGGAFGQGQALEVTYDAQGGLPRPRSFPTPSARAWTAAARSETGSY